jgi:hypothetical protein
MPDFDEPYWSARQLLSWVHVRDRKLIAAADRNADPVLTIELYASLAASKGGITPFVEAGDATEDILRKLRDECCDFNATGIKQGKRQPASAQEWQDMGIDFGRDAAVDGNGVTYAALRFNSKRAMQIWEEIEPIWDGGDPPCERAAVEVPVAVIAQETERVVTPVVETSSDKPRPSRQRERRQIREAIEALAIAPNWTGLDVEPRMRLIEEHLNWQRLQCKRRTYARAWGDYQAAQPQRSVT